ncbi:MAG: YggS family pyridoxal phosphate-dependent enzyme [Gammaproteobacteria bacterium]|nr:YggS family pyridoxal phosphate-dependent enzyme [Gammaproteobacteria bacterium]MDH5727856.1 YggS family pyridoxal phosphate-dependent enzyme [Gammaproteobacteria bacterium]
MSIAENLIRVLARISHAEHKNGRNHGSVRLLAVSKTKPIDAVQAAVDAGQRCFGENYLQDALPKIEYFRDQNLEWHFIGPIQSNKTRSIAESFDWVHSVDRLKIAQRLSEQRPEELPDLNICIQVNLSGEASKSGLTADELVDLLKACTLLKRIQIRGLMLIPAANTNFEQQKQVFQQLANLLQRMNQQLGLKMDTLSMGMSADLEAAIAAGSTIVRIGTDIFGARQ